jgi:hypothetical protein
MSLLELPPLKTAIATAMAQGNFKITDFEIASK